MIKAGDFIRHRKFRDVMILVTSTPRVNGGSVHVEGFWYNMCYSGPSVNIGLVAHIEIKHKDLKDWRICVEPEATNKRNARWADLMKSDVTLPEGAHAS
jgi:hypothetical protein